MQLASAGDPEGIRAVRVLDAQRNVRVELAEQSLSDLSRGAVGALLARKRAVVDHEIHRDRRLRDLLERDRPLVAWHADRVADLQVADARDGDDRADLRLRDVHFLKAVELVELGDPGLLVDRRVVIVHPDDLLADRDRAVVDLADADTPDILVVVNRGNENLRPPLRIALRCRNVIDDGLKERREVLRLIPEVTHAGALTRGCVEERALELLVRGVEVHEELQHLVDDLLRAGLRPVDLVDADDHRKIQVQRLLQDELGLRHGSLKCVNQQDDAVDHFEDTLDLSAEVRMPRCVDDIDLYVLVHDGRVLGEDRDASLPLDRAGIHDALPDFLVLAEHTALAEQTVHEGRLAVVDMCNDCYISDVFSLDDAHIFSC